MDGCVILPESVNRPSHGDALSFSLPQISLPQTRSEANHCLLVRSDADRAVNIPSKSVSLDQCEPAGTQPSKGQVDLRPRDCLVLGLMAKYWMAGQVKTRLGVSTGMVAAAEIHQLFTFHLCKTLSHVARRSDLCMSPEDRIAEVQAKLGSEKLANRWNTVPQGEGDLGQRMSRWFRRNLSSGETRAILIGADCPTLQPSEIGQASDLLARHDVVIGPAIDGGYYLIGARGPWNDRLASLFIDVPWSGPDVFRITCERIDRLGLSLARLPMAEDVDTIVELDNLRQRLQESDTTAQHAALRSGIENILAGSDLPTGPQR